MLVQQPVEGRPGDPQHLGGDAQIIAVAVKHIAQGLALCPVLVIFQRAHRRGNDMLADQAQVSRFDLPAFGQYQPATYPVGQLAHIARPVMLASSLKLRGRRPVSWL